MLVILRLHQDGDGYLKYLLERIDEKSRTIQEYCDLYRDRPIIFRNNVYLNGEVISEEYNLEGLPPRITILYDHVGEVMVVHDLDTRLDWYSRDKDNKKIYQLDVFGNTYYICETDGINFDINKLIHGYGSFSLI